MKKLVLALFVLLCSHSGAAHAMDHRSQYGVGGSLGANFAAPWGSETFRNAVDPKVPGLSAWGRWIAGTPEVGLELSYNYLALGKMNFDAHTAILSFVSRQNPWGTFHPLYGFGVGYASTSNKFASGEAGKWEDPIIKLTAGIEFEMNDLLDVGLRIDHYTIFRDKNTQPTMHILAPALSVNYYFGTPAPMPTENPAPAPVAAPAPAPSAPAVAPAPAPSKHEAVKTAPVKQKPSAKAKTESKPKKKKKKSGATSVDENASH